MGGCSFGALDQKLSVCMSGRIFYLCALYAVCIFQGNFGRNTGMSDLYCNGYRTAEVFYGEISAVFCADSQILPDSGLCDRYSGAYMDHRPEKKNSAVSASFDGFLNSGSIYYILWIFLGDGRNQLYADTACVSGIYSISGV